MTRVTKVKNWLTEHSTVVSFLVLQGIALLTYAVRLETRVAILETRGAPYTVERLAGIDNRLTVLETTTTQNKERLDVVIDVMTRELNITKGIPK